MSKSCKPFKTSEANAKSFLRTKGAIDNYLNILDLNKFRILHAELKEQAKKYIPDFSEKLFFEENSSGKAIPNKQVFKKIDNAKGIYYQDNNYQINNNFINPIKYSENDNEENYNEIINRLDFFNEDKVLLEQEEKQFDDREQSDELKPFIDNFNEVGEQTKNVQKNKPGKQLDLFEDNETLYQLPSNREQEEFVASEKTIRDLAARMSDRIGIPVRFESDRTKQYKGKLENNIAVVNLAYATLDTAPHEILGHSIIRTLKNKSEKTINQEIDKMVEQGIIKKEC